MLWRAPTVIGHRGTGRGRNHWGEDENTSAAIRRAYALGARWIETDAQLSYDGVLVVYHDIALADGRLINQLRVDELAAASVATLADLVDPMPVDCAFDLEAKASGRDVPGAGPKLDTADALADFIRVRIHERPLVGSSFDPGMALRLVQAGVPTGLLGRTGWPWRETVWAAHRLGCAFAIGEAAGVLAAPDKVEVWHWAQLHGIELAAWDATRRTAPDLLAAGIVGLCTDDVTGVLDRIGAS